ncbi:MAG: glycosyltransferase [Saprospiraceae bacterium]|nr:glycosyltransferase [Saprospiraceae bacterium]
MKVLLTNIWLDEYAGTEVYIRDLSIELNKRGHQVEVYSPRLGKVAQEISEAGIHICGRTEEIKEEPDIIHGHQYLPTMDALSRFRNSPSIYFVHDRSYPGDTPPQIQRVNRYVAVDSICRQKILEHGIPESKVMTILNWVDTVRFYKKADISYSPARALVFSNNAKPDNYFSIIVEACKKMNLQIDVIGRGFNNTISNPQDILVKYDIVFAKGKAAIEAMATGAAVIVCDFRGLGGLVLPDNYEYFRSNNFGMNTMQDKIEVEAICRQIAKYNAEQIELVTNRIRREADFVTYVDYLEETYKRIIRSYRWKKYFFNRKYDDRMIRTYKQCRAALG